MRDDWKQTGKEWSIKSKYNSFNSYKGLTYLHSHYNPITKWWNGIDGAKLPPPIELSLDPGHLCNFKCAHCNAKRYLLIHPDQVPEDKKLMTKEHLKNLIDFCAEWGVRAICIGGGGEPLMNKNIWNMPKYIVEKGMKCSFATNGSLINEEIAEQMMYCRWVGVSVDAGSKEIFNRIHGFENNKIKKVKEIKEVFERFSVKNENNELFDNIKEIVIKEESEEEDNMFERVINNIKLLIQKKKETGSKIDIAYKFLIRPDNWQDLFNACKLAKEIGVRDFHARPADLERKDFQQAMELNYNLEEIHKLFGKCHELEDENFRVFTVMHKYDPEFRVQHTFKNCISSPLMLQACSDGNVYVCADHRIEPRFKLCNHFPDPQKILEMWGSDEHLRILKSICVNEECGRCTYGEYARQIEEMSIGSKEEDPMCIDFP